jgi:L-threonylcarbamoyladenylate synthase
LKTLNIKMAMKTYKLEEDNIEAIVLACAKQLHAPGATLVVPTETVYGLVCRWNDIAGIEKIYQLKERDRNKPLAMFADGIAMLEAHGVILNSDAALLAEKFCPGPITIITAGRQGHKTGFRIPNHPFILALLNRIKFPLASTGANLSGAPNALNVQDAVKGLSGTPDIIVDAGAILPDRQASTVIDVSGNELRIIRQGSAPESEIKKALNPDSAKIT